MPKVGDTARDVMVLNWEVSEGQEIESGQILLSCDTDKVEVEIPSPVSGTLLEKLVSVGDEVAVGDGIAVVDVPQARDA